MAFRVRSTESTSVLDPVPCLAFGYSQMSNMQPAQFDSCSLLLVPIFFVKVAIDPPAIELFKDHKEMRRNHRMTHLPCASSSYHYHYVPIMSFITGTFLEYPSTNTITVHLNLRHGTLDNQSLFSFNSFPALVLPIKRVDN
ncbi:hypothetical protein J3F84DRAFT_237470 [Trichoderma pleuroticola]